MTGKFEVTDEVTLQATPDQVWDAITVSAHLDSWFMGHSEIEPKEGGTNRLDMMGFVQESTVTAWEPGKRLAFRSPDEPDGSFMAFEYLIEGREGGSSVLRFVHNGILGGDDWEAQYDGLKVGDVMYLRSLATYLAHFAGRSAKINLFLPGPTITDRDQTWRKFGEVLSLTGEITEGAAARLAVPGLSADEGVVEFSNTSHYVGTRTANGIVLLLRGYQDSLFVQYHGFSDDEDEAAIAAAWQSWMSTAVV